MTLRLRPTYALATCGLALAGCGGVAASTPASAPPSSAAQELQQRATFASALTFTGTYASAKATFRVYVEPTTYRVDVVESGRTDSLYGGTTRAVVACSGTTVCYTVAKTGQAVPAAFDAGLQRIFDRDLPTLAATTGGFGVVEESPTAAVLAADPTARCFVVTKVGTAQPMLQPLVAQTDVGTYCLDARGLPVQLTFASGTITLTSHGGAPTTAQLTPPVSPQPLPSGVLPTASATPSGPVALQSATPGGALAAISPVR